ncbi:Glutathione hydrolase 1 proenzyme [Nymphon striatum]|nr:Glutathione hydrolase 1 proenzyme [Nymphon striatum]
MKAGKLWNKIIFWTFALGLVGAFTVAIFMDRHRFLADQNTRSKSESESSDFLTKFGKARVNVYKKAAVVSRHPLCSSVGRSLLEKKGSAVDAAIGIDICQAVVCPQATGLGGGHFALIYNRSENKMEALDARETAPAAATAEMFNRNSSLSKTGGKSFAVPGQIRGYWEMHQRFGRLPWNELFTDSILIAMNGFPVYESYLKMARKSKYLRAVDSTIRDLFVNLSTDLEYQIGDTIKQPRLAATLQRISDQGDKGFYEGSVAINLISDVVKMGGIISLDDLKFYSVKWREVMTSQISENLQLNSFPPPSSGAVVAFILKIMQGYNETSNGIADDGLAYHRFVEAMKFGYGLRTEIGDPDFENITSVSIPCGIQALQKLSSSKYAEEIRQKITENTTHSVDYYLAKSVDVEDHGTSHICVIDAEGNAVSLTSSINLFFGSGMRSETTGIILGDTMDDFSHGNTSNYFDLPLSPKNVVKPGKRPLSSMSPTIILDDSGNVRLIIGGAGGSTIISGISLALMRYLWQEFSVGDAISKAKLHHQLFPNKVIYENGFSQETIEFLQKLNHKTEEIDALSVLTAISRTSEGTYEAVSDTRSAGASDGF